MILVFLKLPVHLKYQFFKTLSKQPVQKLCVALFVIYEALCFDVAQGRMNGAPNETRTHSAGFASHAC